MRREIRDALSRVRFVLAPGADQHGARRALDVVERELATTYAALPAGKRVEDDADATLAERVLAIDGDVTRWRIFSERLRAQLVSAAEGQVQDRHDILATAASWPPHLAGAKRADGCPACAAVSERDEDGPAGSIPPVGEVPDYLVDALLDGLASPRNGHGDNAGNTTFDIRPAAARAAVVAVLRAWLTGGQT